MNTPVIITDVVTKWGAYKKWDEDYLIKACSGLSSVTSLYILLTLMTMIPILHFVFVFLFIYPLHLLHLHKIKGKKMKAGPVSFSMENYIRYSNDTRDELPLYIFDKKFADKVPQLRGDYEVVLFLFVSFRFFSFLLYFLSFLFSSTSSPYQQVPNYFREDFFSILDKRPDFRWLVAGPSRSGSSFHVDPNSTRFCFTSSCTFSSF